MKSKSTFFTHESASLILTETGKKYSAVLTDFYAMNPSKGHGTKAFTKAMRYCDKKKLNVILEVMSGNPDISNTFLRKYYERFGFVVLVKKPIIMQRNPRK